MTLTTSRNIGVSVIAMMAILSIAVVGVSTPADAAVDNDQGTVSFWTYEVDFAFKGTDAASILWDFGFDNEDGTRATSTEWNPQGIIFPAKGTYIVTQIVSNTVGTYTSQLKIEILGTPEVNFQTFGGSLVSTQIVKVGQTVEKPANPVREGYTFAGWYADTAFNEPFNFNTPIDHHLTVYAKWVVAGSGDDNTDEGNGGNNGNNGDDNGGKRNDEDDDSDAVMHELVYTILGIIGLCLIYCYFRAPEGRRNPVLLGLGVICLAIAGAQYLFDFDIIGMITGGSGNGE
ncbi:MAG: InlB B-repeat-containing protein [archaeon]|nr:InlB B-repeat-containing protein [archaeon]